MEKYSKWQPSLFPHPGAVEAHLVRRYGGFPRSHGDFGAVETHAGGDEAQTRATKPHFETCLVSFVLELWRLLRQTWRYFLWPKRFLPELQSHILEPVNHSFWSRADLFWSHHVFWLCLFKITYIGKFHPGRSNETTQNGPVVIEWFWKCSLSLLWIYIRTLYYSIRANLLTCEEENFFLHFYKFKLTKRYD